MKACILTIIGVIFLYNSSSPTALGERLNKTQNNELNTYYYYTCKVWGFLKYYHSEIAAGNIDWDETLLEIVEKIDTVSNETVFNYLLLGLINAPGETSSLISQKPVVDDELKRNLNLEWFNDNILNSEVRTKLNYVYNKFTPRSNVYVPETQWSGPDFSFDNKYYDPDSEDIPTKPLKLLAVFRYWNIINYFYLHKYLMDSDWDEVLLEYMSDIINANTEAEYYPAFAKLMTKTDDTHGVNGNAYFFNNLYGRYIVPVLLRYVENQYVVIEKVDDNCQLEVGDIIESIGNKTITEITDSLHQIQFHSNDEYLYYALSTKILRSTGDPVQVTILRNSTPLDITISDLWSYYDFKDKANFYIKDYSSMEHYRVIEKEGHRFLYAHMGHITEEELPDMFQADENSEALILDCRNYPTGGCGTMHNWLINENVTMLYKMFTDVTFPGTSYWQEIMLGASGQSNSIWQKPVYILMNETTVSSAEFLIVGYENYPLTLKIGNQTAGAQGPIAKVYLPGNLYTRFSGQGVFYTDKRPLHRAGVTPDFVVKPTLAGVVQKKDEVLEFTLNNHINSLTSIENTEQPAKLILDEVYPNPSNGMFTISYMLPEEGLMELSLYDILGRKVATIEHSQKEAGKHRANISTDNYSSGVYLLMLNYEGQIQSRKAILLK